MAIDIKEEIANYLLNNCFLKVIEGKKNTKLAAYADVLQFMIDNNCKVEQESIKAVELMK